MNGWEISRSSSVKTAATTEHFIDYVRPTPRKKQK